MVLMLNKMNQKIGGWTQHVVMICHVQKFELSRCVGDQIQQKSVASVPFLGPNDKSCTNIFLHQFDETFEENADRSLHLDLALSLRCLARFFWHYPVVAWRRFFLAFGLNFCCCVTSTSSRCGSQQNFDLLSFLQVIFHTNNSRPEELRWLTSIVPPQLSLRRWQVATMVPGLKKPGWLRIFHQLPGGFEPKVIHLIDQFSLTVL